jgi:hypothetical protein
MRKLAGVAAVAALAFGATVVMAASPSPSASPSSSAAPSASPTPAASPSASPSTSSSGSSTTAATNDWTAMVQPVQITGSVTVHEFKSGGGTVTFKVSDILNGTAWSIRLDRGTLEGASDRTLIAERTGDQVQHFLRDTISIHLTKTEMTAFLNARKATEVVAFISDGTRLSVARFPKV